MTIAFEFVQIVLLRKRANSLEDSEVIDQDDDDAMLRGIDGEAIKKEFGDSIFFEGSILPPQDEFCNHLLFQHLLII